LLPNPAKPEPKLTAKTKKETKKIEFGTQELTKINKYFPDFLSSRLFIFLFIFARNLVLRD